MTKKKVPVCCLCRLPWKRKSDLGGSLVSCHCCKELFHQQCQEIPDIVFNQAGYVYLQSNYIYLLHIYIIFTLGSQWYKLLSSVTPTSCKTFYYITRHFSPAIAIAVHVALHALLLFRHVSCDNIIHTNQTLIKSTAYSKHRETV